MNEKSQATLFEQEPDTILSKFSASIVKLQKQLSIFGLTSNQCKVYIFLGKYGSKTASEIRKTLRLPRTEIYQLLDTLQHKGIVSTTFHHPRKFSALHLKAALHSMVNIEKERIKTLEKHEPELKELWETIPTHYEDSQVKEFKFQILQGKNQIHSKINTMISNTNNEFLIIGSEKDFLRFYHANLLETLGKSELKFKILILSSEKILDIFNEVQKQNVRELPSDINSNLCFLIKDNDELLFYINNCVDSNEKLTGMWTSSDSMIYSKKLLFDSLWSNSKVISH